MQRFWQVLVVGAVMLAVPQWAQAHFLFIVAGSQSPDGKAHIYFSELAEPDSPQLLKRVEKVVLYQAEGDQVVALPVSLGSESLMATPSGTGPKAFFLSHNLGVMSRGPAKFLLSYYAKTYDTTDPKHWTAINNPEKLPLELTPKIVGNDTVLQVTWKGKPQADVLLTIEANEFDKLEGTTDAKGEFTASLPPGKRYSIRAKFVDATPGKLGDEEYPEIRHYSTLALELPAQLSANSLPVLDPPVTSFGGAIIGDDLYVYGGHLGAAHHYSEPGQSGRFTKLNLKQPSKWEDLATVPKRTGTAMVPYQGKLIRIGGFVAKNKEDEKDLLVSMADVASYDPATNEWTELTPLPAGRSSHDAVVIGDRVYVAGGWNMQDGQDTVWHKDVLVADLTKSPLVWEAIAVPFQRRAVSAGEWQGKLVVIGGMQNRGGPTRVTGIYDPETQAWTEGPAVQGDAMDGFGSSAFAVGNTLYVSTMSGKLQKLSADGKAWEVIGELRRPRFFHRMLPTAEGQLVFVGGASMESGKVTELEVINPASRTTAAAR